MNLNQKTFLSLFLVIIIEGYVVLSSELLAIRVMVPFVGSGTDTVSIIIAAVLLPLSFGYYFGGQFKPYRDSMGNWVGVREKLIRNILISAAILLVGLSYVPLTHLMFYLIGEGITNRIVLTSIYSALFLVVPVFLLGQTIPLLSNYFSKEKLSQITGKILFVSTIGSFLGATFSTLVLMSQVGVHNTAIINFILLGFLFFFLSRKKPRPTGLAMVAIVIAAIFFNSPTMLGSLSVVSNNRFNVVRVFEDPAMAMKIFSINHNYDSGLTTTGARHPYVEFIEDHFIWSQPSDAEPMNILVVGAGGFTLGLDDDINHYDFIDIDGELKDLAEKYFLPEKLGPNKEFHPIAAEAFIIQDGKKYDMIVLDAFQGALSIPENLVTQEFFQRTKNRLTDNGIVIANFIVNPAYGDAFSRNIDSTFRSVFPFSTREVIGSYNGWDKDALNNVLYVSRKQASEDELKRTIYTDNKNPVYYDKPKSHIH